MLIVELVVAIAAEIAEIRLRIRWAKEDRQRKEEANRHNAKLCRRPCGGKEGDSAQGADSA